MVGSWGRLAGVVGCLRVRASWVSCVCGWLGGLGGWGCGRVGGVVGGLGGGWRVWGVGEVGGPPVPLVITIMIALRAKPLGFPEVESGVHWFGLS